MEIITDFLVDVLLFAYKKFDDDHWLPLIQE